MARERWNHDDRDYDRRQQMERRSWRGRDDDDYEGQGYDPYAENMQREDGSPYHTANLGVPGALGRGGSQYHGGGAFGSRGREDVDPRYRRNRGYGDNLRGARGGEGHHAGEHHRDDDRGFSDKASDEVQSWMGDENAERRRRMDREQHHRGRGPRGYTRSDERISDDVHDRLTEDWMLDASNIEVAVSGGEVTLSGTVENRQDKRRAEDIVDDISGVTHVQNNLRVRPNEQSGGITTG